MLRHFNRISRGKADGFMQSEIISRINVFHYHFYLTEVNIPVQNGHGVLVRLEFHAFQMWD